MILPEAIILAGGAGTRLRSEVSDLPKPMAPVAGRPFLEWLLDYLQAQGVSRVVLSTGYMHEKIASHFKDGYKGLDIVHSVEEVPLGTGGAIVLACQHVRANPAFVINGDTLFRVDLQAMLVTHKSTYSKLTMALKPLTDVFRYGSVRTQNDRIVAFSEKGERGPGLINGGVCIIEREVLRDFPPGRRFSFESDLLQPGLDTVAPVPFVSDDYFIDIGVPEDYRRAQTEIPDILGSNF